MNVFRISTVLFASFFLMHPGIAWGNSPDQGQPLDTTLSKKIIQEVTGIIQECYVFPKVATQIGDYIRKRERERAYSQIETLEEFAQVMTEDLRSVNNDAHLGIVLRKGSFKTGASTEDAYKNILLKRAPFQNFGFKKAERLLGNIGCLVVDEFSYIESDKENIGGKTAKATMQVLANCDALIVDLRDNFGGREEMACLLLNYFFEEPTHILTNHYRGREEKQVWTRPVSESGRWSEAPLYVLTSRHTVSGGEMFAFVLKNQKRATLIGEKTRGAAHKTHLYSLQSCKLDVAVPVGTTIDPETRTDWEGKGVKPDIIVPSGKAMDLAYKMALEKLLGSGARGMEKSEMEWALMEVEANLNPVVLDESLLGEYAGSFGDRKIFMKGGALHYQSEDQPSSELAPMSKDLFSFVDKGMFYVRIRFGRDVSGSHFAVS